MATLARIPDTEFANLVLLSVADQIGTRRVVEWENRIGGREYADAMVSLIRMGEANENDVRRVATEIIDRITMYFEET